MTILQVTVYIIGFFTTMVISEETTLPRTSRLCTHLPRNAVYRWHNETGACYAVGSRGPCGNLMIFYADPSNQDGGQCDCDLNYRCNRPMMYWPPLSRCFLAFEQGPCPPDSWIVFGKTLEPECQRNPCVTDHTEEFNEFDSDPNEFWFNAGGNECTLTGTQGGCPLSNEKTIFNGFSHQITPLCSAVKFNCVLPQVPSLICVPGQKWHMHHGCGSLWGPNFRHDLRFHSRQHFHQGHHRHRGEDHSSSSRYLRASRRLNNH